MPPGERVYFLADMHLKPLDAPNEEARAMAAADNVRLAAFLESIHGTGASLVLLGDAFNFWFERKGKVVGDYFAALSLFKLAADNGLEIHHISGNRDFVVGEGLGFDPMTRYPGFLHYKSGFTVSRLCDYGIEPHGPRYRFHQAGKTVACVHGDAFCSDEWLYMLLRWVLMGPVGRVVMRLSPWSLAESATSYLQGRTHLRTMPGDPGEKLSQDLAKKEIAMGADYLLCGHIHTFHRRDIEIAGRTGVLVAVPTWMEGWYGVLEDGELRIEQFT